PAIASIIGRSPGRGTPLATSTSSGVAAVLPTEPHPLPIANAVTLVDTRGSDRSPGLRRARPRLFSQGLGGGTEGRPSMSFRRLLALAAVVAALTAFAPSVAASSTKPFHLLKTCSSNVLCTVTADTFAAIPAGTD